MKRFMIIIAALSVAVASGAQDRYDALRFSETDYAGTARTLAMGNAFTALGGDLGSLTINPAGSAVSSYSQAVISPGIVLSVNTANGVLRDGESIPGSFGKTIRDKSNVGFSLPNVGFNINLETNSNSFIKNVSLGFVSNVTNTFRDKLYASGQNIESSFAKGLATMASGFLQSRMENVEYDEIPVSDWNYVLGYDAKIIEFDPTSSDGYVGVTENYKGGGDEIGNIGGSVDQIFGRGIEGGRHDMVFNAGVNIRDFIYLGVNLGVVRQKYSRKEYLIETGDEEDLYRSGFRDLRYDNTYSMTGIGFYGKFGVIVTPFAGLRIGAALQTPVTMDIKESWESSAKVTRADVEDPSKGVATYSSETPIGKNDYSLISPMRFNAGVAWVFGSWGLLSADYEICNYGSMRLKETKNPDNSYFDAANNSIRDMMTNSHMLRVGAEVKPLGGFSIRAGYGLFTAPDNYYDYDGNKIKNKSNDHKFSLGLGYSSNRSMFIDIAVAAKKYAKESINPYLVAKREWDGNVNLVDKSDIHIDNLSPLVVSRKWLFTGVVTVGFRF